MALGCSSGAAHAQEGSKYLTRGHSHDWTLTTTIDLRAYQDIRSRDSKGNRKVTFDTWTFENATVVFPFIPDTASSETVESSYTGKVTLDDQLRDDTPEFIKRVDNGMGAWLAKWEVGPADKAREMELEVSVSMTCYETVFNEDAAKTVGWPQGAWPAEAASALLPQPFIDHDSSGPYDMEPVKKLVKEWTNGDPKKVPPMVLAKWVAGQVVQSVQVSGDGFSFDRTGLLEGLDLQGPGETARRKRGSPFDIACFLVAAYREAGLPARLVIGFDKSEEEATFLKKTDSKGGLLAWVEWCLYDESDNSVTWVPVDIAEMRRTQSRLPKDFMNKPLKYFGTHERLDDMMPFAFHFHPPTTVVSYGSPGFWGWLVFPELPQNCSQSISLRGATTSTRGGNDAKQDRNNNSNNNRRGR
jgi:hypothetical protein